MKNILNLFSLLCLLCFASVALADQDVPPVKTISCGFGQCAPDFTANLYLEQSDRTIVDLGNQNNATVKAVLPENQDPRNLILAVNNNSLIGQNLEIDLASKKVEKNTGDFTLIGDVFKDISVNLDGYDGVTGEDASIICAKKFKTGAYGTNSQNFFVNRRSTNPALDPNRCDGQDVQHLQETKFQCQNPGFSASDFNTVSIYRVKFKQRCIGTSIRYKCLQRKMKIKCEWASIPRGWSYSCGKGCTTACSRTFGGTDCAYSSASCWSSDFNKDRYGAPYISYPTASEIPAWSVTAELSRCSPKAEPGSFGGWFAYQRTSQMTERSFVTAQQANGLENLCKQFPNPVRHNYPSNPAWKFNKVAEATLTYPGLDPETQMPLPGSNWIVKNSEFFSPCAGDFDTLSSQIDNWTAFGEVGNSCNDARIPEDTNNLIPWTKAGEEQDPSFGTERVLCSPESCPVQNLVQESDLNFDIIDPTAGANGTAQGNGNLLIYDYKTITMTAQPGIAGNGGQNDLAALNETKYCVKIDDAQTQGILSPFANSPVANFNIYKWQALNVKRGQPSGGNPQFSKNKINIFKKLDSSIRYLLKQEIL